LTVPGVFNAKRKVQSGIQPPRLKGHEVEKGLGQVEGAPSAECGVRNRL